MNRREFALMGAVLPLSGCSFVTSLAKGTAAAEQLGPARQALVDYLPESELDKISAELQWLDDAYADAVAIVTRRADITLTDLVIEVFGVPEKFQLVGANYQILEDVVKSYAEESKRAVPAEIVAFHANATPVYDELKSAIAAQDNLKQGIELLRLLKPIIAIILV